MDFLFGFSTASLVFLLRYFWNKKNPENIENIILSLDEIKKQIMATQQELTAKINELTATVTKVGGETRTLLTRIEELLEQINNGEVTPELQEAVTALEEQVAIVDGLVPDAPSGEGDE